MTSKTILLLIAMFSIVACSSKKPKDDDTLSPSISDQAINPALQGSDSGKIDGLHSIHFAYDHATVDKHELELLKEDVSWIKSHKGTKIQIEGHCDQRGSDEYNLALGDRRAKAVQNILIEMGISKRRLTTISFGSERPIDQGDSEEAYAKNRRANFVPLNIDTQPTTPLAGAR